MTVLTLWLPSDSTDVHRRCGLLSTEAGGGVDTEAAARRFNTEAVSISAVCRWFHWALAGISDSVSHVLPLLDVENLFLSSLLPPPLSLPPPPPPTPPPCHSSIPPFLLIYQTSSFPLLSHLVQMVRLYRTACQSLFGRLDVTAALMAREGPLTYQHWDTDVPLSGREGLRMHRGRDME